MEWGNTLLDDYVLSLTGVDRPKVCFLPTASGDADHYVVRFYRAFSASRCEPSHISLFRRETGVGRSARAPAGAGSDLRRRRQPRLAARDVARPRYRLVFVRGVAGRRCHVWRLGGRAVLVRHAVSGFHEGPARRNRLRSGSCPGPTQSTTTRSRVAARPSPAPSRRGCRRATAPGDSAALHFVGTELAEVVSSRPEARAMYVCPDGQGGATERELAVRYLGAPVELRADAALAA